MPRLALAIALASLTLAACEDPAVTTARFAIPGAAVEVDAEFYDLPFPNDLRRTPAGRLDLSLFPTNSLLVEAIRAAVEAELDGFGLNAAIYARFDGALDPASLPSPAASVADGAAVYLVDVDPASPARGARVPIVARFRATPYQTLGGDHLVARPYPGFPLAEGTTYALVITRRVRGEGGAPVAVAPGFAELVGDGGDPVVAAAREVYAPLLDYLDAPGGDERADVVSAAVFTTQHATFVGDAIRRAVLAAPAPVAANVTAGTVTPSFTTFTGTYDAVNLQTGDVPYRTAPSGEIVIGPDGVAVATRLEAMRFALTVPTGDVPATGWPLVIYSHGTGGDVDSFIADGTANQLARQGLAVISTDQVLHGPRNPGGNPELDFFNFGNPYAARDNALQGAADAFSQLRLAQGLSIVDGARTHTFDPARVMFFGHSQGGLTGPAFVAFEPSVTGAVMSGTAGLLYLNLLHKTQPVDIPSLVETFLRDAPVDEDNPSLALLQTWIERADPVNYAPLMVRTPPTVDGAVLAPRDVFQTEGFTDTYSPNLGIQAFATALGADLLELPATRPFDGLALRGRQVVAAPVTGNLGGATAVLGQYDQRPGSDGHFVVFDIPAAQQHAARFLGTLATTGQATVVEVP